MAGRPRGSPLRAAAEGVWGPPYAEALWRPGRSRAHSLEQAHACCGSQVEGRVHMALLGHLLKRLVQAFNETLASPGRVVCVAGDAPSWRGTGRSAQA